MLLHRAFKSRLQLAPLSAACDLLKLPTFGLTREKHSETTKASSDQVVTSRTSTFLDRF
jgi:hypothetical protein